MTYDRGLVGLAKLKLAGAVVGILVVSLVAAVALGLLGVPSVEGVENRFGEVTDETTVVHTDLLVHNPNPIGLQSSDTEIQYVVRMNEVEMAEGGGVGLDVAADNSTQQFSTEMDNSQIPAWWTSHVAGGERTTVTIDATVRTSVLSQREFDVEQEREVETDIIGEFNSEETRPVTADDPPPLMDNPVLYVNETSATWGTVTDAETPILMDFVLYNPQTLPYAVSELGYEITMNDVPVGQGSTEDVAVLPPGTTETVSTTTRIQNHRLDEWWVTHLRNDQVTELRIEFYAVLSGDDFSGDVRVPLDELTYEETIETDIFGTKHEDGTGDADRDGPGHEDESEGDAESTPTDAPTPSPTPTSDPVDISTATSTDDDGIGW